MWILCRVVTQLDWRISRLKAQGGTGNPDPILDPSLLNFGVTATRFVSLKRILCSTAWGPQSNIAP
jgi:hypothetical protein